VALLFTVSCGDIPICCPAHCLQIASSVWNASKGLPSPGRTRTLGPIGSVAHPEKRKRAIQEIIVKREFFISLFLLIGRSGRWYDL
jgi:hypothetical protein